MERSWPQFAAIGIALLIWQIVVLLELKPVWVLPGPVAVLGELWHDLTKDTRLFETIATTMRRAAFGFGLALLIGSLIGSGGDPLEAPENRRGVADHRPADHAVHRVVPARDPASSA